VSDIMTAESQTGDGPGEMGGGVGIFRDILDPVAKGRDCKKREESNANGFVPEKMQEG